MTEDYLSFKLSDDFIEQYKHKPVDWGYKDAAGNSLGEITFLRTYSRKKEDGTKERWHEVCRRVIEGTFSLQKDWSRFLRTDWHDPKAQNSAQEMYERMFEFKWLPPGRGLWSMGTELVNKHKNSAPLQNCAFISTAGMTKNKPSAPFAFLMEASALGVGVGFDTKGADKKFTIYAPNQSEEIFVIPDTREGWVEATSLVIDAFLSKKSLPQFDYSQIRKAGEPIKTFGGTAAGPEPLKKLHALIAQLFENREGQLLTTTDIADIGNLIGACIVAGNVRRSAELLMGSIEDKDFLNLKNRDAMAYRENWAWMSNNSVDVSVGTDLSSIIDGIVHNGEPGVIWMDVARQYGRLVDPPNDKDVRIAGFNPCSEQCLESGECCTLVETFLNRHESLDDFKRTLKFAYLYAKTVTLLPTHWPQTNAIMQRNRRIGTSVSGIANFVDKNGMHALRTWFDEGYKVIQKYDQQYSEWLCVRESIKTTTVKPSGTVSILAGESPGVHWAPGGTFFNRTIRFAQNDPLVPILRSSGYRIEKDKYDPNTAVVYFPVKSDAQRSEKQVSLFEKAALAVEAQRWWSDNGVSVTLTFDPDTEKQFVPTVLHMYEGQLKAVSFLSMNNATYDQPPYAEIFEEDFENAKYTLMPMILDDIYAGLGFDAIGEKFCSTDACEIREFQNDLN